MSKSKTAIVAFLVGCFLGHVYGRWTMLWWDIDRYHALRMDFKEQLEKLNELMEDIDE